MSRKSVKYIFDKERAQFRRYRRSPLHLLGKAVKYFLISASLAVVYYIAFSLAVNTEGQAKLKKINKIYQKEYTRLARREASLDRLVDSLRLRDNGIYRQIFKTDAPEYSGLLSAVPLSASDTLPERSLAAYTAQALDSLELRAKAVEENLKAIAAALAAPESSQLPLACPLDGFTPSRAGATVGYRINPFYKLPVLHKGFDMLAAVGDPVYAAGDGRVEALDFSGKGLGNVVVIRHSGGLVSRYGHLENITVSRGQKVRAGQQIARVGLSGNSFAPHLHYAVLRDTLLLDPVPFLAGVSGPDAYAELSYLASGAGQSMD